MTFASERAITHAGGTVVPRLRTALRNLSSVRAQRSADARQNFMLLLSTIFKVLRASAGTAVSSVP